MHAYLFYKVSDFFMEVFWHVLQTYVLKYVCGSYTENLLSAYYADVEV